MSDFTQHRDTARRESYRRRHAGIYLKDGRAAYTVNIPGVLELAPFVVSYLSAFFGARGFFGFLGLGSLTVNLSR